MRTTFDDLRDKIDIILQVQPGYPDDYDIQAIAEEIRDRHGLIHVDDVSDFWEIVRRHDRSQQD